MDENCEDLFEQRIKWTRYVSKGSKTHQQPTTYLSEELVLNGRPITNKGEKEAILKCLMENSGKFKYLEKKIVKKER